jgi:hypothetical protein
MGMYWYINPDPEIAAQNLYERDARLFESSLGFIDSFTDEFKVMRSSRNSCLQLPTVKYLNAI